MEPARHGLEASLSRAGNCYDNAVMESFWSTLKSEPIHRQTFPTRAAARQAIFEYVEVFYNTGSGSTAPSVTGHLWTLKTKPTKP